MLSVNSMSPEMDAEVSSTTTFTVPAQRKERPLSLPSVTRTVRLPPVKVRSSFAVSGAMAARYS